MLPYYYNKTKTVQRMYSLLSLMFRSAHSSIKVLTNRMEKGRLTYLNLHKNGGFNTTQNFYPHEYLEHNLETEYLHTWIFKLRWDHTGLGWILISKWYPYETEIQRYDIHAGNVSRWINRGTYRITGLAVKQERTKNWCQLPEPSKW